MARKKREKKDSWALRYSFYLAALVLVVLIVLFTEWYNSGILNYNYASADLDIATELVFAVFVLAYLFARGKTLKQIIARLGLSRSGLNSDMIANGLKLFLIIFVLEVALSVLSQTTGVQVPTNVGLVLQGMPIYFLVFAFTLAPVCEEIFFRGYLIPWFQEMFYGLGKYTSYLSVLSSSIIFASLHAGYGSVSEIAAALIFGIIAGYYFVRYKSLYQTITAHTLVNLLTVLAFVLASYVVQ